MANDRKTERDASVTMTKYRNAVNEAIAVGIREALLRHKRAGNPVAVSRKGRVVILQPAEIVVT